MTTIELERGTHELVEEEKDDQDDDKVCHLYYHGQTVAVCGFDSADDPHATAHSHTPWSKGILSCTRCGRAICMDCILIAS